MILAYEGCGNWRELRSWCYPLQHFDDSLVLMVYDALMDC